MLCNKGLEISCNKRLTVIDDMEGVNNGPFGVAAHRPESLRRWHLQVPPYFWCVMKQGKIKCVARGYYRVRMHDGKLFTLVQSQFDRMWKVYAGMETAPENRLGEFLTLSQAKNAIVNDFSTRDYPDYKAIWYGTKWGNLKFNFFE